MDGNQNNSKEDETLQRGPEILIWLKTGRMSFIWHESQKKGFQLAAKHLGSCTMAFVCVKKIHGDSDEIAFASFVCLFRLQNTASQSHLFKSFTTASQAVNCNHKHVLTFVLQSLQWCGAKHLHTYFIHSFVLTHMWGNVKTRTRFAYQIESPNLVIFFLMKSSFIG